MVEAGYAAIEVGLRRARPARRPAAAFAQIKDEAEKAAEATVAPGRGRQGHESSAEDLAAQADELERQAQARTRRRRRGRAGGEGPGAARPHHEGAPRQRGADPRHVAGGARSGRTTLLEIESLRTAGLGRPGRPGRADPRGEEGGAPDRGGEAEARREDPGVAARGREARPRRRAGSARPQAGNQAALREELELLRAANDYERERIRIKNELLERTRAAEGDLEQVALARKIADEKLAELERQIAEDAERTAAAAKETATATASTTQALRAQLDITKRFAALPGSGGLFGFGARPGRLLVGLGDGARSARARTGAPARPKPRACGRARPLPRTADVPDLPDLAPHVQAVLKAWQKVPPLWERLEKELRDLESGTVNGVDRMGRATERAVLQMKTAVRDLQAKVRSFEERLKRAADLGVAGG